MSDPGDYLLLLGASADQLCSIHAARALGIPVVTVDANPASPGFAHADAHAVVSTRDVPALKAFADRFQASGKRIGGVLVQGTDIPQIGAELALHLGLPSIPLEAAMIATDKLRMKEHFRAHGIPVPWFRAVTSLEELQTVVSERGFPLVLKPVDRSGARGVYLLTEGCDLAALHAASLRESLCGRLIVEAFTPGPQLSTESLVIDGVVHTPGWADRNYEHLATFAPNIIENGGFVPTACTPAQRAAVEDLISACARALGVRNGVIKGDIVIGPDGPAVIEVALRLSGGDFSATLIPLGTGVDIIRVAILRAMGRPVDPAALVPTRDHAVINQYFFPPPGRLRAITGLERVEGKPWLHKLEIWRRPGDTLPVIRCHADRAGVFIVTAPTRAEAEARAREVNASIQFHVEP